MIPKIIHYCWFGRNPKPEKAIACMKSWRKFCPDYQIIEWNEDNFNLAGCPLYVQQAYQAKKWAFVTDYVRLKVVYENGGIYMDTDVELLKKPDDLLKYQAYFGFEEARWVATGLGFGAEKGSPVLKDMMDDYNSILFILEDGSFNLTPCPQINTAALIKRGLICNNQTQLLQENIKILSSEYLCPMSYQTGEIKRTRNTVSIHWFAASWKTEQQRLAHEKSKAFHKKERRKERIDYLIHMPNRFLISMLGQDNYQRLKQLFRRG